MKKYSIILPVRNGGNYLKDCVASILNQSYTEFDLHILDNCSTDGSIEWIKSINDPRIILFTSEKSLAIEESWERVLFIRKNEFITLIGHDDILHSNYLEIMNQLIGEYPEASLYQSHFNLIDNKGKEIRKCKHMSLIESAPEFLDSILSGKFDLFGTGFMMRSELYDKLGGIPLYPNLLFADFELWMKFTLIGFKVTSPVECFSYRLHQSTTKLSSDLRMHQAFMRFISFLKELKSKNKEMESVLYNKAPFFIENYCRSLSHRLLKSPLNKRKGLTVKKLLYECQDCLVSIFPKENISINPSASLKLALLIDSNIITRTMFLGIKKLYPKPILK